MTLATVHFENNIPFHSSSVGSEEFDAPPRRQFKPRLVALFCLHDVGTVSPRPCEPNFWHSKEETNEIDCMVALIDQGAASFSCEGSAPVTIRVVRIMAMSGSPDSNELNRPKLPVQNRFPNSENVWAQAVLGNNRDHGVRSVNVSQKGPIVCSWQTEWLLDDNALAAQKQPSYLNMGGMVGRDGDNIEIVICYEVMHIACPLLDPKALGKALSTLCSNITSRPKG